MLPFTLPDRPAVTRIRQRDLADLLAPGPRRTQPLRGFEDGFTDIVDYIVRITEEIWRDRRVDRIYETYDASCTVYTTSGVIRSVEEVVAATVGSMHSFPDEATDHLSITWSGDETASFYTSHLGLSRSTHLGASSHGPATGRRVVSHFVADCVSRDNRIHTEWLVHDSSGSALQLGLDVHAFAQSVAEAPSPTSFIVAPPTRLEGQAPRARFDGPTDTPQGWAAHHFHDIWNRRDFGHIDLHVAPDVVAHWPGGRGASDRRGLQSLVIGLLTSLPDAAVRVEHVSWSEETDGVIVAVRWTLEGSTRPGGLLGGVPPGRIAFVPGMTHFRFGPDGAVVEEWTVFDEVAVLAQAYRA